MEYRFPKSRTTRQQEIYDQVSENIFNYIKGVIEETNAETLWLGLRSRGFKVSQSTFNTRLKTFVEEGLIIKRTISYNKYSYLAGIHSSLSDRPERTKDF